MATSFITILTRLLELRELTPHRFAVKVGLPADYIYLVLNGQRPPPVKYLEAMASILGLGENDRYAFMAHAAYANVPEPLRVTLGEIEADLGLKGLTADLQISEAPRPDAPKPKTLQRRKPRSRLKPRKR
jgi:predicted transcriptional regulator